MRRLHIGVSHHKRFFIFLIWVFPVLVLVSCQQANPVETEIESVLSVEATEIQTSTPLDSMEIEVIATVEEVQETPTVTPMPSPSNTPTETPLPEGFSIVQDVLDPEVPSGTIIDQDPPPGTALPRNEIVFLYRSFQALQMYAGGACQPLKITLPSGKLLYWVNLEEGVRYTVETDFAQGHTQISDYRMYLIAEFDNATSDSIDFTPLAPGRYVISLGPYKVEKSKLENGGVISAGCLWITPEDLK
jgi:hypothetical protein